MRVTACSSVFLFGVSLTTLVCHVFPRIKHFPYGRQALMYVTAYSSSSFAGDSGNSDATKIDIESLTAHARRPEVEICSITLFSSCLCGWVALFIIFSAHSRRPKIHPSCVYALSRGHRPPLPPSFPRRLLHFPSRDTPSLPLLVLVASCRSKSGDSKTQGQGRRERRHGRSVSDTLPRPCLSQNWVRVSRCVGVAATAARCHGNATSWPVCRPDSPHFGLYPSSVAC